MASAFEVTTQVAATALDAVDLDAECDAADYDGDPNRALMKAVILHLGRKPSRQIENVRWFHLTRVPSNSSFEEGILPLSASLTKVWETISSVVGDDQRRKRLAQLRLEGVPDFQYQHKVGKPHLAGPYAMLVRDSAFSAVEMGNHDYLGLPEIVEDICNGYRSRYGDDIAPEVRAALRPCIVTFLSSNYRPALLEAAMRYVYEMRGGEGLSVYTNHVFDGANTAVPRERILAIEYVQ